MVKFLIKRLIPAIVSAIRFVAKTKQDHTGSYLKVEIYILDHRVINRRIYFAKNADGSIAPDQKIEIK